jgi:glucose/mannose transport system permease protein
MPDTAGLAAKRPRRRRRRRMPWAALLLAPSFLIVSIFVYVFIAYTVGVALSRNWKPAKADFSTTHPIYANFESLLHDGRFQADIRNAVVFTLFFLTLSVVAGFVLAVLVHNLLWAKGFFRGLFLLPYALSFVATGVVWRWLFNPISGINLLLRTSGVSSAYQHATGHALQPDWTSSPVVVGDVSSLLERLIPGGHIIQVQLGIPLALIAVVLAASWQLMGFAMAMFLAGLASIPEDVREASMIDGASGARYYGSVVIPLLRPIAITTIVILTHVALKMFDLIYAMSGSGIGFATDMPGIFVFETMFKGLEYNIGAAASLVMLVLVTVVVVPYLARRAPQETS